MSEPRPAVRAPLLLYSLAEFRELIFAGLEVAGARSLVEVGSEAATFTRELSRWAAERDGRVRCVEPEPSQALLELAESSPALEVVMERSPAALETVPAADAYFLDGDHNYWTVLQELRTIERRAGDAPYVVFLHDVAWPCARRDLYYAPETLPPEAVHPHTWDEGVAVDRPHVVPGGHRGEGEFAWALEEGGPRNGVLTAVEDFLADHDDLAFARVPCIFGLGVLYRESSPFAAPLAALLDAYQANRLLDRMERNRLDLYLKVLELQDVMGQLHEDRARLGRALEDTELHVRDVATENRALRARVAELEDQARRQAEGMAPLVDEADAIARSRAFVVAERLSQLRRPTDAAAALSAQRLREALAQARRP